MASDSITELPSNSLSDEEGSAFIFKVPECVSRANPDAFLPRLIGLGPLNAKKKKESYKRHMANKVRGELRLPEFDQLCTQLGSFRLRILACYDTHLEIDGDKLGRVMLVDALFLLRLLLNIYDHMDDSLTIVLPLPDFDGQFHSLNIDHKMLVNDVLKLQNQIPLVVFQGILGDPLMGMWPALLYQFSKSLSPFAFGSFSPPKIMFRKARFYGPNFDIFTILDESHHLLHFMYLSILIIPGRRRSWSGFECSRPGVFIYAAHGAYRFNLFRILEAVLDFIQNAMELIGLIQKLVEAITMRMVKKQTTSSPVIPSASHLHKLSVNFQSTDCGIGGTSFTKPKRRNSFHQRYIIPELTLPVININAYTETLFENLLAFEAMANIHPPVYSHYIALMKALIRTPRDVTILKENGIIMTTHLDNDEEVVKLFQTLGSSISNLSTPTFKKFLPTTSIFSEINEFEEVYNRMIVEINQYYDKCWTVQATRLWKMFVTFICKMGPILFILFQIYKKTEEMFSKYM